MIAHLKFLLFRYPQFKKERKCWRCKHEPKQKVGNYALEPCKTCFYKTRHPDWELDELYGGNWVRTKKGEPHA